MKNIFDYRFTGLDFGAVIVTICFIGLKPVYRITAHLGDRRVFGMDG